MARKGVRWRQPVPGEAELIEQYRPAVKRIAALYARKSCKQRTAEECETDGLLGALEAIRTQDDSKGASLKTRICNMAYRRIIDGARDDSEFSRQQVAEGLKPPLSLDWSQKRFSQLAGFSGGIRGADGLLTLGERLCDREPAVGHQFETEESLRKLLRPLGDRHRLAVILYCLYSVRMWRVGELLGLSESRVSQMISQASEQLTGDPNRFRGLQMRSTFDATLDWLKKNAQAQADQYQEPVLLFPDGGDPAKDNVERAPYFCLLSQASKWELANAAVTLQPARHPPLLGGDGG